MSHESTEIAWNTANIVWNDNDNFWNEVIDIIQHGGKSKGWNKYDKDIQNIEIYLDDIKLIAEEIKRNVQIIHG